MNKYEINATTGEEITTPLEGAELKAYLDNEAKNAAEEKAKAEAEAKAEADKAALLTKLGISADEAKLLLS
jgi:hypothetical protein